jgi:hypothetical protein
MRLGCSAARSLLCLILLLACPVWADCAGDCDGSGDVTIDEIITLVNVALESAPVAACRAGDRNGDGAIAIDEIVAAVNAALGGCPLLITPTPTPTATPEPTCPAHNPQRNVYFGDLHVHTTYSFDAHMFDVRTTPGDAYRFARGQALALPPLDANGQGTQVVRIDRPLDFTAVTDHAEYLGEVETCSVPGSTNHDAPNCQTFRAGGNPGVYAFGVNLTGRNPRHFRDICGDDGELCRSVAGEVWQREQAAAAAAYERCHFTSFVAYEYSNAFAASTLHRNVIFRNENVPVPVSTFEQNRPLGLWRELHATCKDAGIGCDVLAIPHNSNESNGRMFLVEYPGATTLAEERSQAELRAGMEPLFEIYQHKGNSECFNGLSGIVGATDEACDFERRRPGVVEDCGDAVGQTGAAGQGCVSRRDYIRNALLLGLQERQRLGVNPFALGFIGSTDTHNGTPGLVDEETFIGHRGTDDADVALRLGAGSLTDGGTIFSPGALAAVWAEQNTRDSLFDALRRRETYATSGPRITVRVFGGWDLPENLCANPDLIAEGYARGVPMGADLPPRGTAAAPRLVISALRDPGTIDRPGVALQRLQVVKGWLQGQELRYQVFDVAGDPANGAGVDLETCIPQGTGFDSLCTVWSDPNFDPTQPAYYYVRVLENPSCRWTAYTCNRLPPQERPAACSDPAVPKTLQERAWTSPIWYGGER